MEQQSEVNRMDDLSKRLIYAEDAITVLQRCYCGIEVKRKRPVTENERFFYFDVLQGLEALPSAQPQLEECPIYGGMCGYPSNLCYECPRHGGAHEKPLWWTAGLQPFTQPQSTMLWQELLRILSRNSIIWQRY